jgi:NAD(P)H-hydrate repair Nnr-like enzyme with NAD(P)H-hydrate dehydratase domain
MDPTKACMTAALTNRYMGEIVSPTPATLIGQLIPAIPDALKSAMSASDR